MHGIVVRGIVLQEEATVTDLAARLRTPRSRLVTALGRRRRRAGAPARRRTGDKVTVILPAGGRRPASCRACAAHRRRHLRRRPLRYDSGLALVALDAAAVSRRRPDRRPAAPEGPRSRRWSLPSSPTASRRSCSRLTGTNRNWFSAVQVEKRLMSIILS
jgi:lipoprotein-releasing system permease protein